MGAAVAYCRQGNIAEPIQLRTVLQGCVDYGGALGIRDDHTNRRRPDCCARGIQINRQALSGIDRYVAGALPAVDIAAYRCRHGLCDTRLAHGGAHAHDAGGTRIDFHIGCGATAAITRVSVDRQVVCLGRDWLEASLGTAIQSGKCVGTADTQPTGPSATCAIDTAYQAFGLHVDRVRFDVTAHDTGQSDIFTTAETRGRTGSLCFQRVHLAGRHRRTRDNLTIKLVLTSADHGLQCTQGSGLVSILIGLVELLSGFVGTVPH